LPLLKFQTSYNGNTRTFFYLTNFVHYLLRMFYLATSSAVIADIPLSLSLGSCFLLHYTATQITVFSTSFKKR